MSAVLDQLQEDLARDLTRVKRRFKNARVTLVIRQPDVPGDSSIVMSDDDLDEAIAEIRKLIDESPHGSVPPCSNTSPRWFSGHWRDWHRGHGCEKDDGKPRSEAAKSAISNYQRRQP